MENPGVHRFLGAILRSLVSALLLSAILFCVSWALVTGEFPPRPQRVKAGFQRLQTLAAMSEKIEALKAVNPASATVEEQEVDELLGHFARRQKVGSELLAPPEKPPAPPRPEPARPVVSGENSVVAVNEGVPERDFSVAGMERRLRELELEVDRLKREVRSRR
jgi:hypothetical protein